MRDALSSPCVAVAGYSHHQLDKRVAALVVMALGIRAVVLFTDGNTPSVSASRLVIPCLADD
jgi:hypothetical protein